MPTKDDGGSAFPCEGTELKECLEAGTGETRLMQRVVHYKGMALRDYFAAKALPVLASVAGMNPPEWVAKNAYEIADAMIEARK